MSKTNVFHAIVISDGHLNIPMFLETSACLYKWRQNNLVRTPDVIMTDCDAWRWQSTVTLDVVLDGISDEV